MERLLRIVKLMLVAAAVSMAQTAPPSCPANPGNQPISLTPAVRPTGAQIIATAEAAAADPTMILSAEPMQNFGVARYRIADYAECVGDGGCYWSDLDAQTRRASAELDSVIAKKKAAEKLALVLDIDETSLTNFCELRRMDYGFLIAPWTKWAVSPEAAMPIKGTLELFNKARAAGIEVFFITGRGDELLEATAKNLELAGYKGWKGLALRVGPEKQMTTVDYKSSERKKIVDAGYRIVLSVGDQWSDLDGSPKAEISVKLPNPFYYLP